MLAAIQNLPNDYRDALVGYQELVSSDIDNTSVMFEDYLDDHGISIDKLLEKLGLDEDDIQTIYYDCEVTVGSGPYHYPVLVYRHDHERIAAHSMLLKHFNDLSMTCSWEDGKPAIVFLDEAGADLQFVLEHISIIVLD